MNDWIIIVIAVIILLLVMFFLPQLMIGRAMKKVIKIFRENNAVDIKSAKTV